MALSNKDFVGETLDVGLTERLERHPRGDGAGRGGGRAVFRAHEVAATRRTVDMVAAIAGTRPPARTVRALA